MTPLVNVGFGDSDQFLALAQSGGIAHPPGYSLYVNILHLAAKLPIPVSLALKAHLVSGLSTSIALYVLAMALYEVKLAKNSVNKVVLETFKIISLSITLIAAATSKLIWLYSLLAEKYIFAMPFISLLFLLSVKIINSKQPNYKINFFLSFTYVLLLMHLPSTLYLAPFILFILVKFGKITKLPVLASVIAGVISGVFLTSALIMYQSKYIQTISWQISPGIKGILELYLPYQSTFETNRDYFIPASLSRELTIDGLGEGLSRFLINLFSSFNWWIIIPIAVILTTLKTRNNKSAIVFGIPALLSLIITSITGWPNDLGSQSYTQRAYIPLMFTFVPLIYLGLFELFIRLSLSAKILGRRFQQLVNLMPYALLLALIILIPINYKDISIKQFQLTSKIYKNILSKLEPNSILTCYSSSSCNALLFEQTVNQERLDVTVVPPTYQLVQNQQNIQNLFRFNYPANPHRMFDIVTWNLDKKPVYAVDITNNYYDFFGISQGFMYYIPKGYVGQLSRQVPENVSTVDGFDQNLDFIQSIPEFDLTRRSLIFSLSSTYLTNGLSWQKIGDRNRAQDQLNQAVNLGYKITDAEKQFVSDFRTQIETINPDPRWSPGQKLPTVQNFLDVIKAIDYDQANASAKANYFIRGAVTVDPSNSQARLELAKMYLKQKDFSSAKIEFENLLTIDPENSDAKEALKKLAI